MTYQVGDLIDFKDDDPEFKSYSEALDHAETLTIEDNESYFGVWTTQDDGGDLIAIFHAGIGYWS